MQTAVLKTKAMSVAYLWCVLPLNQTTTASADQIIQRQARSVPQVGAKRTTIRQDKEEAWEADVRTWRIGHLQQAWSINY